MLDPTIPRVLPQWLQREAGHLGDLFEGEQDPLNPAAGRRLRARTLISVAASTTGAVRSAGQPGRTVGCSLLLLPTGDLPRDLVIDQRQVAGRFLVDGRIRVERLGLLRHWGPRRAQARRVLADLIRAICAALAFSIRFANS
jgi:hypothetical protein